jgi:uncharacterized coiled-coil DUF342 family protein
MATEIPSWVELIKQKPDQTKEVRRVLRGLRVERKECLERLKGLEETVSSQGELDDARACLDIVEQEINEVLEYGRDQLGLKFRK